MSSALGRARQLETGAWRGRVQVVPAHDVPRLDLIFDLFSRPMTTEGAETGALLLIAANGTNGVMFGIVASAPLLGS